MAFEPLLDIAERALTSLDARQEPALRQTFEPVLQNHTECAIARLLQAILIASFHATHMTVDARVHLIAQRLLQRVLLSLILDFKDMLDLFHSLAALVNLVLVEHVN